MLRDVKNTATKLNKETITCSEYEKYGSYGRSCAYNKIGGWKKVLEEAGLKPTQYRTEKYSPEYLLEAICQAWIKLNRQPNSGDVKRGEVGPSINAYLREFKTWQNCIVNLIDYINERDNDRAVDISINSNAIRPTTSRTASVELRERILKKYNYTCQICKKNRVDNTDIKLEINHIVPYSRGGETLESNLQVLCRKCNASKSNKI